MREKKEKKRIAVSVMGGDLSHLSHLSHLSACGLS